MQIDKLLILDKSAFHGTSINKLKVFVKHHCVILPYTLVVECGISQKVNSSKNSKDPMRLIQRLSDVVKNGAFLGKSPAKIVSEEKSRNGAIESLIDMEQTQIARNGELNDKLDLNELREKCDRDLQLKIDFVKRWAKEFYKTILEKNLEKDFRRKANELNLQKRLREWLLFVDSERDKMSANKWEWQMTRLYLAWGSELASRRNNSGPSYKLDDIDISNDIYDIYYVSHLLQADGLITHERKKGLVPSLAMAAFPDKNVFCSIDDV